MTLLLPWMRTLHESPADLLLHAAHLEAADVDPVAVHVEAGDARLRLQVEQIEDRRLARVGEVVDRVVRAAALAERDTASCRCVPENM